MTQVGDLFICAFELTNAHNRERMAVAAADDFDCRSTGITLTDPGLAGLSRSGIIDFIPAHGRSWFTLEVS